MSNFLKRREQLIKEGKCPSHPKRNVVEGKTKCRECRKRNRNYYEQRIAQGKCPAHPERKAIPGKKLCRKCQRDKKELFKRMRRDVLLRYCGGRPHCQCFGCRTTFIGFLQMDHVKRGSRKRYLKGMDLLRWLIEHNYPNSFQVLCANCNGIGGKGIKRQCPMHGKIH
jgi:hypothetical protein